MLVKILHMSQSMFNKLCLFLFLLVTAHASLVGESPQADPLPSWNEGPVKQAIIDFVRVTVDPASKEFVSPEDRIVTFDQDGTLWVEHPLYPQGIFALDRVKTLAPYHPEWKEVEPFKSIISNDREAVLKMGEHDWEKVIAATHTGMSIEDFQQIVKYWLSAAKHPRFNRPYTDLVYQPILEVIQYLRANGFKTFIVTGGGQEFVRVFSQAVYGIPSEQVIGSTVATKYEYHEGRPQLLREPKVFFIDNFAGKAIGINLFIGKRPYAAFGNSTGDKEMLEWTQGGAGKRIMLLVHHDDPVREYAYGPAGGLPDTDIGKFSDELLNEARNNGWFVISMKKDWKRIFSFQ